MPASDYQEPFSARIPFPEYLERNREQVVKLEVYRAGAIQAPGPGTFSLFDPGGVAIVDAEAISVVTSRAQYTIPRGGASVNHTSGGRDGQEEWGINFTRWCHSDIPPIVCRRTQGFISGDLGCGLAGLLHRSG